MQSNANVAPSLQGGTEKQGFSELDLAYGLEILSGGQLGQNEIGSYTCRCTTLLLVRRTRKNGIVVYGRQCQVCSAFEPVPKKSVTNPDNLPAFREEIGDSYRRATWALYERDRRTQRNQESSAWWSQYNSYLRTPEWQERRRKVFARAGGTCECCLDRAADQVHHTTYEHVGNEPLWELRAICEPCHEQLTAADRARRSA